MPNTVIPKGTDRPIKACVLDFDGTLYPSSAGIEAQIKERFRYCARKRLHLPDREIRKLLEHYRKEYRSSILGLQEDYGIDPNEFYEELYNGLDISTITPKHGLHQALKELAHRIPLFVLSNSNRSFVTRGLLRLGYTDVITDVFTVEDHGFIRKPHREVYDATILRIGVPAEMICMFDDIPSSLRTAKACGFLTVLVGNGLRNSSFVDLHTNDEYDTAPDWCDLAAIDIASVIRDNFLAE